MNSFAYYGERILLTFLLLLVAGCDSKQPRSASPSLTPTEIRSARRAYDGSPPIIPHKALGVACVACHTETGKPIPNMAFAPANPHGSAAKFQNCRQCHLFQQSEDLFVASMFAGLPVTIRQGDRLFAGAPPTIPHSLLMRENCLACHSGPSARPEIRCTHPEQQNCRQCHVKLSIPAAAPPEFSQIGGLP